MGRVERGLRIHRDLGDATGDQHGPGRRLAAERRLDGSREVTGQAGNELVSA
jgi:hypothetical protein